MADTISWIATIATVIAASMTASNLGTRITGYGFCVFLTGSLSWLAAGILTDQPALTWTNVVLTILNVFGIWRWLGRQRKIEEGASTAAAASESEKGETLFPVSLLMRASLEDRTGKALGSCIDAMAGCSRGSLQYIVVSQGGVAGMGETLRRVPWPSVIVEGENVKLGTGRLDQFHEIAKDEWPSR
jgi:hypothetical protein